MSDAFLDNEKAKKKLTDRAAQFAINKSELTTANHATLLVFNIGKEQKYGIDFDAIERVIPHQNVQTIPSLVPLFSGLIYYNAEFFPVVNLKTLFRCNETDTENNFILLYNGSQHYALTIGAVVEQLTYNKLDLFHPSTEEDSQNPYLLGFYKCDIAVIDAATILKLLETTPVHK
jgi:chemotaxis signal transduction protein